MLLGKIQLRLLSTGYLDYSWWIILIVMSSWLTFNIFYQQVRLSWTIPLSHPMILVSNSHYQPLSATIHSSFSPTLMISISSPFQHPWHPAALTAHPWPSAKPPRRQQIGPSRGQKKTNWCWGQGMGMGNCWGNHENNYEIWIIPESSRSEAPVSIIKTT